MNARHPNFLRWAEDGDPRTANRYAIVYRDPCAGIGWVLVAGDGRVLRESQGAFYDNAADHPEGAIAWATTSALAHKKAMAELGSDSGATVEGGS